MGSHVKRGALIVLEGCDKAGKSTQSRKLVEALKGKSYNVKKMQFPDRATTIGKMIGDYLTCKEELDDHAIHLLFSANRWELMSKIKEDLLSGTTLVVDRYAYSGVAFTASKPGFDVSWCKQTDAGLIEPDVVFYLDVPQEVAQKRSGFGQERYESREMQLSVQKIFQKLKDPTWKVIDASRSVESVHKDLVTAAVETINASKTEPLSKLWSE